MPAKFQSLKHVLIEDTKGFMLPEKFQMFENGACKTKTKDPKTKT